MAKPSPGPHKSQKKLQLQKDQTIMLLADKGYDTGTELQACQQDN
jgi:hypothetical protein